jgi:hypothetical protein
MLEWLVPPAEVGAMVASGVGVECVERLVDISHQSADLFAIDQSTHQQGSVMAYRAPDALDSQILPTHLRYQFAWEEILGDVRPLGPPMSNTHVRKGLVTKLYKVTLDLPITLKAIPVRQVSNLVEHPVAVVHARGCCRSLLMTSPPAPPLQNAHLVSLPIAPQVPATHAYAPSTGRRRERIGPAPGEQGPLLGPLASAGEAGDRFSGYRASELPTSLPDGPAGRGLIGRSP